MFAQLGDHIFQGLKTPTTSSEVDAVVYGQITRINQKPQLQPTGAELREISLTIMLSIDFTEPTVEINSLKKSMHDFEALPYITGDGLIVGKFVITSINIVNQQCAADGRVELAIVSLSLLESPSGEEPQPTGQALNSQKPAAMPPSPPVPGPAASIANDVAAANTQVSGMKQTLTNIRRRTTSFKRGVREVRQMATNAQTLYSTAATKLAATQKIIQRASEMPGSLDEAIRYAENLAKLDNVADVDVLELHVNELSASADKVSATSAPAVGFTATKEGGQ